MTIGDVDSPAQSRSNRLRFDRYVLDLARGGLFLDGQEIALRPKTFAVLRHLVEHAGRLVSKDELFAAVWPNLAVTDDVLVQGIGELRRALGDDGQRLIRTIPRRGYRFEAEVSDADAAASAATDVTPPPVRLESGAARTAHDVPSARRRIAFAAATLGALLAALGTWGLVDTGWRNSADRTTARNIDGAKPAIAVLPLVQQGDDRARDYFADGLTQDVINALGRFPALTVMSWNAVFPYKGKPASPDAVGRGLAVGYLVEGNVRVDGDRVRVMAQLVDTRQGQVLWSARFDEPLTDVFAVQDNIATQIVRALAIRVTQIEQRRVLEKPTDNLEAYDYVLRARPALQRPTRANNAEARVLLRRAVELDPKYAAAHSALAETYYIAASLGWAQSPTEFLRRAEDLAGQALALDDEDVRAHIVLGRIHIAAQRYDRAAAEIERAIAINPNDASALAGRGNILMWSGKTDAALAALELAQRIDPELNAIDRFALSLANYLNKRYDAAIEQAELNLRRTPNANFSLVVLAAAYAQYGRPDDVERVVGMIRKMYPTFDPQTFGNKFLNAADLDYLRDGLRKAGLYPASPPALPPANAAE